MSEFTSKRSSRIQLLNRYMIGVIEGHSGSELVRELDMQADDFIPSDVLSMFDLVFGETEKLEEIKRASNKLFNILYETLKAYPLIDAPENSFIDYLIQDNIVIHQKLQDIKPFVKRINKSLGSEGRMELLAGFAALEKATWHYTVKENILFPILESNWKEHDCLKLMWSFHDDIRKNLTKMQKLLSSETIDLEALNSLTGALFFNISTIIFREERVLFPIMMETLGEAVQQQMLSELETIKLPFVEVKKTTGLKMPKQVAKENHTIRFATGEITLEQAELIFNHLPIDITFVDENETVRFFSDPAHRIFPRTAAIIGRKVQNCHPPESVGVVNKIVASFKNGEKDVASFWFHMGPKYVMIQYFAVRDSEKKFRGVLEVSQEISEIQKISGERKLLDW